MHEDHSGSVGGPRRGQGLRHASRIDVLVAKKDEYQQFSANAGWVPTPGLQEDSVEAV